MTTILVGTPREVRLLAAQLALTPPDGAGSAPPHAVIEVPGVTEPELELACASGDIELAILTAPRARRRELAPARSILSRLGVATRFVPPIEEQVAPRAAERPAGFDSTPLDLASLVGREPHEIDRAQVSGIVKGKTVLVTGAGGSIGAELVRVCAGFAPARIVMMERAENALFEIDRAIGSRFPGIDRVALLHDVVDAPRTASLIGQFRPDVVFHAAAHKHVPLMEDHPALAVTNNVFGTRSIADACVAAGVGRFVLISSDKAVRPSSVMGATKRLAERYVQSLAADPACNTRMSMVRFGNVLGSSGSVLTIWGAQLAEGGPLTVTDERMTRYFMTINEAASLVVQAAAFSGDTGAERAGEVFVLDMGDPVRILDLAARYALACGYTPVLAGHTPPASDCPVVEIVLTEARPGEKLHEQLAYSVEQLAPTLHPGIRLLRTETPITARDRDVIVRDLESIRHSGDRGAVLDAIRAHVAEISPGGDLARVLQERHDAA